MKLYAERDAIKQGQHYLRHVEVMTAEGLHSKADIAAELAHRDIEIERLRNDLNCICTPELKRADCPAHALYCSHGIILGWHECGETKGIKWEVWAYGELSRLRREPAEAKEAARTWENEAERRSRRYEKCAVELAEVQGLLDKSVSLLDKPQGLLDSAADQPSARAP